MEEFPSNSRRASREMETDEKRQPVERVVSGRVTVRKKPIGRRLSEMFFGSEDARGVWQYVVQDVLVPAAKDMVTDAITGGVERALFGEVRGRGRSSSRSGPSSSYVPYNRYSTGQRDEPRREISHRSRAMHQFDELGFKSLAEAQEVLESLELRIKNFGMTSVADFYETAGVSAKFVDENWGWTDLRDADIRRVRGGEWVIVFPPTEQLN